MDIIFVRLLFVIVVATTCFVIDPFNLPRPWDAGVGTLIGAAIVVFEWKLRAVSLKRLIGAAIGSFLGICGAYLFRLGHSQQCACWKQPKLPADTSHALDGLRRAGGWCQQGRPT